MRRRYESFRSVDNAPRVDGAVVFGFIAVLALTVCAFATVQAYPTPGAEARAYSIPDLIAAQKAATAPDRVVTSSIAPTVAAAPMTEAPKTSNACNLDACGKAFRSFDPRDCTFQPFEGPRRLCTR